MLRDTFTKWLWDARRALLGWALAIVAVGGGYAAFWPTIDTPGIQQALEDYPQGLLDALNYDDISTAAGYLTASVYGLLVAVLLVVHAVAAGARAIAGDEQAGTLDLIAAHPVSRTRLGLQRFAALVVGIVLIAAALWIAMLALIVPAGLDGISIGDFAAMHAHLVLFGSFFGALAYAAGGATGRKPIALSVGAGVGVIGYLANGIIPQVDGFEWVRNLSPFHWLTGGEPLRNGLQIADGSVMIASTAILVAYGTFAFTRRDIAV